MHSFFSVAMHVPFHTASQNTSRIAASKINIVAIWKKKITNNIKHAVIQNNVNIRAWGKFEVDGL